MQHPIPRTTDNQARSNSRQPNDWGPPQLRPLAIPSVEKPRENFDQNFEQLDESTLEKQAKSAAHRDAHERKQHLDSLNRRIEVLQQKLDSRESDLREILPKLARLERSEQISKVLVRDGTVILAIGGVLVSAGSLFAEGPLRFVIAGLGGGILICGLWICKLLNQNVWPTHTDD